MLVVSAMMARSLQRVLTADLGFELRAKRRARGRTGARSASQDDAARSPTGLTVKERVGPIPKRAQSALALAPPFGGRGQRERLSRDAPAPGDHPITSIPSSSRCSRFRFIAGRTFAAGDDPADDRRDQPDARATHVRHHATSSAMGFPRSEPRDTIIGVAGDTSHDAGRARRGVAELYRPLAPTTTTRPS